jgi:hypothetical protein
MAPLLELAEGALPRDRSSAKVATALVGLAVARRTDALPLVIALATGPDRRLVEALGREARRTLGMVLGQLAEGEPAELEALVEDPAVPAVVRASALDALRGLAMDDRLARDRLCDLYARLLTRAAGLGPGNGSPSAADDDAGNLLAAGDEESGIEDLGATGLVRAAIADGLATDLRPHLLLALAREPGAGTGECEGVREVDEATADVDARRLDALRGGRASRRRP